MIPAPAHWTPHPCIDTLCQSPTLKAEAPNLFLWRTHRRLFSIMARPRAKTRQVRRSGRASVRSGPIRVGRGLTLQRHLQNILFYHKDLRGSKRHFPLSLTPGKPRFYVSKFGQYTQVTL